MHRLILVAAAIAALLAPTASTAAARPQTARRVLTALPTPCTPRMYAVDAGGTMQLYCGDGQGHLTGGQAAHPCLGCWGGFHDITTADFTGDGWPDVAAIDANGQMQIYIGSASGQLSGGASMWPCNCWGGFRHIAAADYTGDGAADITGVDAGGDLRLYVGDRAGHLVTTSGQTIWGGGAWSGFRQVSADARAAPCAGARTVVEPVGDSITIGYASQDSNGYRGFLQDLLSARAPYGCRWLYAGSQASGSRYLPHEGIGGATIAGLAARMPASLIRPPAAGLDATLVLWCVSARDAGNDRTAQQMLDDTSAALDRILGWSPLVRVLVCQSPIVAYNTPAQQAEQNAFDDGLPALAASKGARVRVVDTRDAHLSSDRVHPDDVGYQLMAARISDALTAAGWLP